MTNLDSFCQNITLNGVFSKFYIILLICFLLKNLDTYKGFTSSLLLLMKKQYRYFFVSLAIVICCIFLLDFKVNKFFTDYYNNDLNNVLSVFTSLGIWYLVFGLFALLSITCMIFKKHNLEILFKISALSGLYAEVFNYLIKLIFMKTVHHKTLESYLDFLNYQITDGIASGHVIVTVATATTVYLYSKNIFIKTILVLWVLAVIVTRVYLFRHWLSDVLIAITFGYAIGYVMYKKNKDILSYG